MAWFPQKSEASQVQVLSHDLDEGLGSILDPSSPASEGYRVLRTNLVQAFEDDLSRNIVLTSPSSYEGQSNICANLGMALAQLGKNTLAVDCDLREPTLHRCFGVRNVLGIVDVLVKERNLQEVWHEPSERLKVVTVGAMPPNPAELVDSEGFSEFLSSVREEFDYVLLNSPPMETGSDALILASQADGVLLILDFQNTSKKSVWQSVHNLNVASINLLGTVVDNV